ncbi:Arginine-tRNA-protein transferase [Granulibacter bethesdensis CGDNIH4]|nr:Arginine-tRNA-protein transferase [Granulibacter bethesdensis CGDNIH4]
MAGWADPPARAGAIPYRSGSAPDPGQCPMNDSKPLYRPQFFYTTGASPCPYLDGRMERKVVTEITGPDAETLHNRLSRAGFRRSHNIAYAPVCQGCNACVPIRIAVNDFRLTRTRRRINRANAGVEMFDVPAQATHEQFMLFQRYQKSRHGDGDMAAMGFTDYRAMVEDTPIQTSILEFRDQDDVLLCACLTDRLNDGLSAVYSFYDPDLPQRSLGSYAILSMVAQTKAEGLPYLYLGYWVANSRKMAYKSAYQPAEILSRGAWRPLTQADIEQQEEQTRPLLRPSATGFSTGQE